MAYTYITFYLEDFLHERLGRFSNLKISPAETDRGPRIQEVQKSRGFCDFPCINESQ